MGALQQIIAAIGVTPPPPAIRISETFEGTGQPTNFDGQSVSYDDTVSPLSGAQSMSGTLSNAYGYCTFTAIEGTAHFYFQWASSTLTGDIGACEGYNGAARLFRIRFRSTGAIRIYQPDLATFSTSSGTPITAAQKWHVWVDYTPGSGSNAVIAVSVSTDGVKPETPTFSKTDSVATDNCNQARFPVVATGSPTVQWDNVVVSEDPIGDNPL